MSGPELRIVELTLPSGTWYTLRQDGWDEAADDSGPFLTRSGELYVFRTPGELLAWCASPSDDEHELAGSPLWASVPELTAAVREDDRFDLTWSTLPADGPLDVAALPELHRSACVVDDLLIGLDIDTGGSDGDGDGSDDGDNGDDGDVGDDGNVVVDADLLELWHAPELLDLQYAPEHLDGALAGRRRQRLADMLRAHAAAVVRMVDRSLTLPEPAAAPASPAAVAVPLENVAGLETVWIGLADSGFFTLREIATAGDAPAYLGTEGRLIGATELAGLRGWLASSAATYGPHDLLDVPGWSAVTADPDAIDLDVYDDDMVDLAEVGNRLGVGLDIPAADAMNDAWLLLADLADWGEWEDVRAAIEPDQPVGFVLSAVLPEITTGDPRGSRRMAELDLDALSAAWAAIVAAVAARIDLV